jgi:hypothetical protein
MMETRDQPRFGAFDVGLSTEKAAGSPPSP